MIENVMSTLYCGTLNMKSQDFNPDKDANLDFKLYHIELSKFEKEVSSLLEFLSPSEYERAKRYHFSKDKNRFIICRAALKFLLGKQTGMDIKTIVIKEHLNKKPYLPTHPFVYFNVAHAGEFAMIAIANNPVGVDIEYINRNFEYNEILASIFNKSEIEAVFNSNDNLLTFYKLWTRKEAIVKATGKGIDDDFLAIPSLDGYYHLSAELLGNIETLQVFSFELNETYIGCVALSNTSYLFDQVVIYPTSFIFEELLKTN